MLVIVHRAEVEKVSEPGNLVPRNFFWFESFAENFPENISTF
jgi:hypothetical protein